MNLIFLMFIEVQTTLGRQQSLQEPPKGVLHFARDPV